MNNANQLNMDTRNNNLNEDNDLLLVVVIIKIVCSYPMHVQVLEKLLLMLDKMLMMNRTIHWTLEKYLR